MPDTKYFTISLPRTGTSSLTKMALVLGLSAKHCVHNERLIDKYNFFTDTPCFSPNFLKSIINSYKCKFIYIDRDPKEWFLSFNSTLLASHNLFIKPEFKPTQYHMKVDRDAYIDSLGNNSITISNYEKIFQDHKKMVLDIVKPFPLLIYNFSQGWKPFCSFLNMDIPSAPIPHINKGRMFEQIK